MYDIHSEDDSVVPNTEWETVAEAQKRKERLSEFIWDLPIDKFRAIPYVPPPLPTDTPVPGIDLKVSERWMSTRDGHNILLRIYTPLGSRSSAPLFFNIHGGGWVLGSAMTEEAQNRLATFKNRAVTVSVNYRRAPEFQYPYPLEDCHDALLWCKKNATLLGIDDQKIVIGGGSAGANLAASLAQICRRDGIKGIVGQVLNIPVTCHPEHFPRMEYRYDSYNQNAAAPIVSGARMRWFWDKYLPDARADSLASPLLEPSLSGLPPALVQIAGLDPLRDEGLAYAARLQASGVEVQLRTYSGMPHAFYIYPELPSSRKYLDTTVEWIGKIMARTNMQLPKDMVGV